MFVGQKCSSIIRNLELTPVSSHLDQFYHGVFKYHQKVASKLQTYFTKGLSSLELQYMASFSPYNSTELETPDEVLFLANNFSKIMDEIKPGNGFDILKQELELGN